MYKVRDVASLLKVETVEIHKKLIALKSALSEYISKKNGITYIDDKGVEIIARSFAKSYKAPEKKVEIKPKKRESKVPEIEFSDMPYLAQNDSLDDEEIKDLKARINRLKTEISYIDQEIYLECEQIQSYSKKIDELRFSIQKSLNRLKLGG